MTHESELDHQWTLVESDSQLEAAAESLAGGVGPVGVDAERASGFRYFQNAYLVQAARRGSGTFLFDPTSLTSFAPLAEAIEGEEWIFHAASQDLICLAELNLVPQQIFDTELAARLLGFERVGLGAVVENLLGITLEKAHSASDWSQRPLPVSWLDYAALDVTLLPDLRDAITEHLTEQEKLDIARQEFQAVLEKEPKPAAAEPWRRLSGLGKLKDRVGLSIARELWEARDELARELDVSPGKLLPDSSILVAAMQIPRSPNDLARNKGFRGRASRSELDRWWRAVRRGKLSDSPPALRPARDAEIPHHRSWERHNPEAAARLGAARAALAEQAEALAIPLENLLTPSILRTLAWQPPDLVTPGSVSETLEKLGARPWQRDATAQIISAAFVDSH